jgi:hypothetical protein
MVKVVDNYKRGVLIEGRDNGMAFGFLQKIKDDEFHTVQPPSPCKDYLAEVVFTEKHGIPTKAYGLNYKKKLGIFSDTAYMTIKMMKRHGGGGYSYSSSFENDVKQLADNYKHIQRLMREFEKSIGLKVLTTIKPANNDFFVVSFSSDWCKSSHSISLYSLLLRILMVATAADKDIMSFLSTYSYHYGDKSLLAQSIHKIKLILKEKKLPPNTIPYSKSSLKQFYQTPHDNGIIAWNSSFNEVKLGA